MSNIEKDKRTVRLMIGLYCRHKLHQKEMYQVRKSVKDADPASFIVVVESHEVHGEGFKMTNIGEAEQ